MNSDAATSQIVQYFQSTLKRLETESRALDSLHPQDWHSLYLLMTTEEKEEITGLLMRLKWKLGPLYETFSAMQRLESYSRTGSTILPSFGVRMELKP